MNKKKLFNDPIYGFISYPFEAIYDVINHPYFQRLRRISQMGLSHYVYPGALHTRFHHALGALHLMTLAIQELRKKGKEISEEEALGVSLAILTHDIGHGPFSHALEHVLIEVDHETLSLHFMEKLNQTFDGLFDTAIAIFKGSYPKTFLHELVSSQLDMDRMDYLNRDSFFTGVIEGQIGYGRIIKMLDVHNDQIVVEEKGIHSVEQFLMSRRVMYRQVYLHKTSIAAEQMLIAFIKRYKKLFLKGERRSGSKALSTVLAWNTVDQNIDLLLENYALIDDVDILYLLKESRSDSDPVLRLLANDILDRNIFKIIISEEPFKSDEIDKYRHMMRGLKDFSTEKGDAIDVIIEELVIVGKETNLAYDSKNDEIKILFKNRNVQPISVTNTDFLDTRLFNKYFLCYPR